MMVRWYGKNIQNSLRGFRRRGKTEEHSLCKHPLLAAFRFKEEDATPSPLFLVFADFAFSVKVPNRFY